MNPDAKNQEPGSLGEKMSFSQFMADALYGPNGYYTNFVNIGGDGADFYTAALSPLFSSTLGRHVVDRWQHFGSPELLQVVEIGAGQGELAVGVCQWLEAVLPTAIEVHYVIVDVSSRLEQKQKQKLLGADGPSKSRIHFRWGLPSEDLPTVVLANEVLDALPVERVRRTKLGWQQAYVDRAGDSEPAVLVWKSAPPHLCHTADRFVACPVDMEAEVCLSYADFFTRLATYGGPLEAAFFDYGITRAEWESGIRPKGTIRAYARHQVLDVLANPGTMDLTADVNWDHVQDVAREAGFEVVALTSQADFLMRFGILEVLQAHQETTQTAAGAIKQAALAAQFKQLVFPGGMGERFSVMTCSINERRNAHA